MKYLSNPIIKNIIIISIVGICFLLLFDYLITIDYVKNWNLSNLNNLFNSIGFILTAITIYLLYINYTQQKEEFKKINDSTVTSNNFKTATYYIEQYNRRVSEIKDLRIPYKNDVNFSSITIFFQYFKMCNERIKKDSKDYNSMTKLILVNGNYISNMITHYYELVMLLNKFLDTDEIKTLLKNGIDPNLFNIIEHWEFDVHRLNKKEETDFYTFLYPINGNIDTVVKRNSEFYYSINNSIKNIQTILFKA